MLSGTEGQAQGHNSSTVEHHAKVSSSGCCEDETRLRTQNSTCSKFSITRLSKRKVCPNTEQ